MADATTSPNEAPLIRSIEEKLTSGTLPTEGSPDQLNLAQVKVTTAQNEEGKELDFVTVPYKNDGDYNYQSNVTVAFDPSDTDAPVTRSETLYSESRDGKFKVEVFQNGKKVKDETTDVDYVDGETLEAHSTAPVADPNSLELQGWGTKVACIGAIRGVNATGAG